MNRILELQGMEPAGPALAEAGPDSGNPFSTLSLTQLCLTSTISIWSCLP